MKKRLALACLSLAPGLIFLGAAASPALAQPPARELFDAKPTAFSADIVKADLSGPMAKLHVVDESGTAWVIEGATSNTVVRGGVDKIKGLVDVVGFQSKDRKCEPECRLRLRDMTLPDGRKILLGSAGR